MLAIYDAREVLHVCLCWLSTTIETYHQLNSAGDSAGIVEGSAEPADSLDADPVASCRAECCSVEAKHFLLDSIRNRCWSTDRQQHEVNTALMSDVEMFEPTETASLQLTSLTH